MTPKPTYREMLLDPRWQRKRLHVLEAHGWACDSCGAKDRTLHVHHKVYWPGCAPWQYRDGWLSVLCSRCHTETTADAKEDRAALAEEGVEADFHKRIFGLLPAMDGPGETEDLIRDLATLDESLTLAGLSTGAFAVLWPLQTGAMPQILAAACAQWLLDRAENVPREREPFEIYLRRAIDRATRPGGG